jgi:hypothetical protein
MLARLGPEIIDVEPADDDLSGAKANPRRVQSSSPGAYQLKGGVPATGDPGTNHRLLNLKRWRTSQPVIVDTYPADLDLAEVRVVQRVPRVERDRDITTIPDHIVNLYSRTVRAAAVNTEPRVD